MSSLLPMEFGLIGYYLLSHYSCFREASSDCSLFHSRLLVPLLSFQPARLLTLFYEQKDSRARRNQAVISTAYDSFPRHWGLLCPWQFTYPANSWMCILTLHGSAEEAGGEPYHMWRKTILAQIYPQAFYVADLTCQTQESNHVAQQMLGNRSVTFIYTYTLLLEHAFITMSLTLWFLFERLVSADALLTLYLADCSLQQVTWMWKKSRLGFPLGNHANSVDVLWQDSSTTCFPAKCFLMLQFPRCLYYSYESKWHLLLLPFSKDTSIDVRIWTGNNLKRKPHYISSNPAL